MNLTKHLNYYRDVIQHKNISYVSEREATRYYDNMTMYIDILLEIQRSLAKEILEKLDESSREVTGNIIISTVLIFVVLALCPIQVCRLVMALKKKIWKFNQLNIDPLNVILL